MEVEPEAAPVQPEEPALAASAVGELFAERYAPMVRLAFLLTGSNEVAEDLVQDCFARLHRKARRIDVPAAYLRTMVVNACRSWHRTRATPSVNSCIERGLFDQFLGNNGGAAATVGDPPVEFGVVPNTVPKVRVEMANGTNVEANTTPLEGVSGVNLWVTAVPDGVGVKKIDSLDATGKVIGTTQSIVPYSFIAPSS
jgi:DNA-directed RNA polymerase specialized sigma24 family protein